MKRKVLVCLLSLVMVSSFAKENKAKSSTASRFEKLELFNRVLHLIENQYYREVDTEKLIQGAIKGMMGTLDPHSAYLDNKVFSKMQEDTKGEFGGLGIEVSQKDGMIVIITPILDTPAYKAGIKPGDKIVEINHESILGYQLEDVIDRMKGKTGTKIVLGIARDGADGIIRFKIKRTLIKVSSVKRELVNDRYGYIRLIQFQKGSGKGIEKAIKKLKIMAKKKKTQLEGIVLDLRNNPGGLLDEAVNVSSIFLKGGVVVSTEARDPKQKEIRYVKKTGHKELKIPLVVLINGSSASASEIVAGALQDSKRALIVGEQSFGKGSVQSVAPLGKDQGVKLTIAQYMTPSNKKIQAIGIVPDIEIANLSSDWIMEHKQQGSYIRERDLKNHLNATIESKEEKESRLKHEKIERKERIAALNKKKKKKDDKGPIVYVAAEDYQILQAIKILRSYKISREMK